MCEDYAKELQKRKQCIVEFVQFDFNAIAKLQPTNKQTHSFQLKFFFWFCIRFLNIAISTPSILQITSNL